jgi:hypothetical protein
MFPEYRVTQHCTGLDVKADTTLPFAPFVGLQIVPPWSTEYMSVEEVLWDAEAGAFEIYLA